MSAAVVDAPAPARREIRPQPGPQELFLRTPADIAIIGGSVFGGKALALDTPIPTPSGWTTMGDLRVGDVVFDEAGRPTRVCTVTPPYQPAALYDVTFSDGTVIRADGEHLWLTSTLASRASARNAARHQSAPAAPSPYGRDQSASRVRDGVVTTETIRHSLTVGGRPNHAVAVCAPLDLPPATLPIDPYTLGAWLGDGTTRDASITCADQPILDRIAEAGYHLTKWAAPYVYGIRGLAAQLRAAGLVNVKRIPPAYLRASVAQRLALAQGLMDTDGTVNASGQCELSLSNEALAGDALELLRSLGIKVQARRSRSSLNGAPAADRWRMKFRTTLPIVSLPRKAARLSPGGINRHLWRGIVAVEPVPAEPVCCIGVEAASHLFLASRAFIPTHNTWSIVYEPLRNVDVPGFTFVLFRREMPRITNKGGMWDESTKWYPLAGGVPKEHTREWTFPSGAAGKFAGLQHEKDIEDWKGAQIALIGFDQLEEFTEKQFFYMFSRNRSTCGVRPYMRGTCNPDPDSFLATLLAWWIDAEGWAIPDRSGVIRWLIRVGDDLVWSTVTCGPDEYDEYETREALAKDDLEERFPGQGADAKSLTFVLARLQDNAIGNKADPAYLANVRMLPLVDQQRLLGGDRGGNWKVREVAGKVFNRAWFKTLPAKWAQATRIRYWDKAGTEGGGKWTAGVLMALHPDGRVCIEDIVRGQWSAANREPVIKQVAHADGPGVTVWIEQEPGSGGKESADNTILNLRGFAIYADRVSGDKLTRANPLAAQALAGNVYLLAGDWNEAFLREAHAFEAKAAYKDQLDAAAGAFNKLTVAGRGGGTLKMRGTH